MGFNGATIMPATEGSERSAKVASMLDVFNYHSVGQTLSFTSMQRTKKGFCKQAITSSQRD